MGSGSKQLIDREVRVYPVKVWDEFLELGGQPHEQEEQDVGIRWDNLSGDTFLQLLW